jgi:tellurite resistance protein TerC
MFGRLLVGGSGLLGQSGLWVAFALPVLVLLCLDFGLFLESPREPSLKESLAWTAIWGALAAVFGITLGVKLGPTEGFSFLTAYVVEQALSVDNLFVFMLVFGALAVPSGAKKRALAYGVLGALVLRVAMLAAGGAFLSHFHALAWLLGALLLAMGLRAAAKLWRGDESEESSDHRNGAAAKLLGRFFPIHDEYDGDRFTTQVGGRSFATPLLVAVITILFADVVFALDSIPAVLGVSTNPVVVITSNVFAVLGLRSMFFVVSGLLARLKYLPHGLAAVLVVVGAKMLLGALVSIPTWLSLASVLGVLAVAVAFSLRAPVPSIEQKEE